MKLSRFFLNGVSRAVHRCIADSHHLHTRVLSMFPDAGGAPARETFGVLHRLEVSEREGRITLLVQSREAPDPGKLPEAFLDPNVGADGATTTSLEPFLAALVPGEHLRFRLRANPTRKIATKTGPDGVHRNGRRVPVRGDDERQAWILRKLAAAGLQLLEGHNDDDADAADDGPVPPLLRQRPEGLTRGRRAGGVATHDAHLFEGVALVVDPMKLREAVEHGIGSAKAFGFGLLSLARA